MDADSPILAPWAERSRELGVQPVDARQGVELLMRHWGADRYFAALGEEDVARLHLYVHFVRVCADKELIGQNEQGDYMIIVLDGTALVERLQPQGNRVRLAEAHAGDVLGEMSLLDDGMRFSACRTLTACTLAVIDRKRLDEAAEHDPRLGLALVASLSRRLSLRLRTVSSRLSALLSGR
jgi:CRP-like cAMP-binding protein